MQENHERGRYGIDANGCATELVTVNGQEVLIHYDDVPESDIGLVDGIRCTTPLRTVIDIAAQCSDAELEQVLDHCLDRRMFTLAEAKARIAEPDVANRPGTLRLKHLLTRRAHAQTRAAWQARRRCGRPRPRRRPPRA